MKSDVFKEPEKVLSFARYISWADLLKRLYEEELKKDLVSEENSYYRQYEWRSFGLMCYWYASLYVVIDAWEN